MRTALIDADVLVYEAARSNEVEIKWDDDLWTLHSFEEPAKAQLRSTAEMLREKVGADQLVMALSDYTDPWRKRVMPTYKSNRKDVRRPLVFGALRDYVHAEYKTYQKPGLEGDDILGILATHPSIIKGEKVVVSIDKDMKTIPGEHFKMRVGEGFTITEDEANYWHLFQTLTGDTTDGYPGCPGVGPKKAEAILTLSACTDGPGCHFNVADAWDRVVAAYVKAGFSEDVALMNARVARICRHTDYDYKTKSVKLWTP